MIRPAVVARQLPVAPQTTTVPLRPGPVGPEVVRPVRHSFPATAVNNAIRQRVAAKPKPPQNAVPTTIVLPPAGPVRVEPAKAARQTFPVLQENAANVLQVVV